MVAVQDYELPIQHMVLEWEISLCDQKRYIRLNFQFLMAY